MSWNGKPPIKTQTQTISSPPPPKGKPSIKQESQPTKEEKTDLIGFTIITKLFGLW